MSADSTGKNDRDLEDLGHLGCVYTRPTVWNRYKIGTDKLCVYTGPGITALNRLSYQVPNGFTSESDPVWNCTVPRWYRASVNPTQIR